jgi:adenylate cyclase, class 2
MIEVEIRAKVHNLEQIKDTLNKLKAVFVRTEKQVDHVFGRIKDLDQEHKIIENCFSARIREKGDKRCVEFKEIKRTGAGMEFSSPLASLESGLNFLDKLDFKEAFKISKIREIYKYKDFEICLDNVEKLGFFIEIEHPSKDDGDKDEAVQECRDLLNVIAPDAILEPKKYGDLMQEIINQDKK